MRATSATWAGLALAALFIPAVASAAKTRWIETHSWTGHGTVQTEKILVHGQAWRIRSYPRGRGGLFQIGVYDEQGALLDIVGAARAPSAGVVTYPAFSGRRYLAITGVDVRWTVAVEQLVGDIEQFQLREALDRPVPELAKLGTWTGDSGTAEYELTVPKGSWTIVCRNTGKGALQVVVEDEQGRITVAVSTDRAAAGVSWIHRSGRFKLRFTAIGTTWSAEAFGEAP